MCIKKTTERASGIIGLTHLISCPQHGLLGLALLLGAGNYLPKSVMDVVKWPHNFATQKVFYPMYDKILPQKEEPTHLVERPVHHMASRLEHSCTDSCCSHSPLATNYRALDLAHTTTTVTGYGSLALYAGFLTSKIIRKRRKDK